MSAAHDAYFAEVEERFSSAVDFTIGLEEEFQLLDPASLALVNRFEELRDAARGELAEHIAGELISSEIEVITGRCDGFAAAADKLLLRRRTLCDLADEPRGGAGGDRHASLLELEGPAHHRHAALPAGGGPAQVCGLAQQHLERTHPRGPARQGPGDRAL